MHDPSARSGSPTAGDRGPGAALQVQLQVAGRRCVVVGAGRVGSRRARTLVEAGGEVLVIAPDVTESVEELARTGRLELHRRGFDDRDLDGAMLVVAATGVADVDERVSAAARSAGVLVNRADRAALGDLAFPAVVRRGPVAFAVSTGGRAPALAAWLAELLDDGLGQLIGLRPEGYELLVEVVEEVREELRGQKSPAPGASDGAPDWRAALDASILDMIDQGRGAEAKERLLACLSSS